MSYFDEVYLKRLNRYGLDYQSRLQGQRERNFENYLLKTPFRVDFQYLDKMHPASLERYKQDYSETQAYLLTRTSLDIPNGTVLEVITQDGDKHPWMIWWLEQIASSGYNKYVVLKMTHQLTWTAADQEFIQWGYFRGPGTVKIQDAVKSSTGKAPWTENDNLYMFITPYNKELKKEIYFTTLEGETTQAFIATDVDVTSTKGISYVSVDPTLIRDISAPPTQTQNDSSADFYWLNGGNDNGGS